MILLGNGTMSFERGLKRARKNAGYKTQEIFADSVQRSIDTVRNWEQGKNKPSLDDFMGLCEFLHCDADYLLDNLDVQSHDLDFVCKYTGLSAAAVEKLHAIACAPGRNNNALKYFSDFVSRFCGRFMHKLLLLEQSVFLAEDSLREGETNMGYAELRHTLFDFSEFCKKIPDELFNSGKVFSDLEKKTSYRAVNVSESEAVEFIKNSD